MRLFKTFTSILCILAMVIAIMACFRQSNIAFAKETSSPKFTIKKINNKTGLRITITKTKGFTEYYLGLVKMKNSYSDYLAYMPSGWSPVKETAKKIVYVFSGLPKGTYTFKMEAYNSDSEEEYSDQKTVKIKAASNKTTEKLNYDFSKVKEGEIIKFGSYEQDANMLNGKEAIEWIVLYKSDDQILVLSKYILDNLPFDNKYPGTFWKDSSVRKWLNGNFYKTAFSSVERKYIQKNETEKGVYDKVFLLSFDDATDEEFGFDPDEYEQDPLRKCAPTEYAIEMGKIPYSSYTTDEGRKTCTWMLTSICELVLSSGAIDDELEPLGYVSPGITGVRPAIWISIQKKSDGKNDKSNENKEETDEKKDEASGYLSKYDFSDAKKGDIIKFGSYEQDNKTENGKDPIEWVVLNKTKDQIFIVSKDILDYKAYNQEYKKEITWEECTLRTWLNDEFYENAFNSTEKGMIKITEVKNLDNTVYNTTGGNDTKDKIYLLSQFDMINSEYGFSEDYDEDDINRRSAPTAYAIANGGYDAYQDSSKVTSDGQGSGAWWLRSPGNFSSRATLVNRGDVSVVGGNVNNCYGIRPALNICIKS